LIDEYNQLQLIFCPRMCDSIRLENSLLKSSEYRK